MTFHPSRREPAGYGMPEPVRLGEVAQTASIADRLTRIEARLDDLVRMISPLFGNPSIRQAIGTAITSQSLKVRK
jgi:hypothetical protein